MGNPIVRLNDPSDHGGSMVTAENHLEIDGEIVCVDGDMHSCPIPGHGTTAVRATTSVTYINGKPVIRVGDSAGCGARITSGSPSTSSD